jgi:antitoxin component YwqK of YwqJK toxin-antitoxin module
LPGPRERGVLRAMLLLLALLLAVTGVGQNRDGTLFVMPDQVVECPHEQGDGAFKRAHPNGEVSLKGKCKGGLYVDTWKAYYPNGEKAWQVDFVAGQPDGTFKAWYDNGKDQVKVSYAKGKLSGKYKAWHPNGKLAAEGEYKDGKKAGCWETYFDNGEHESKGAYDSGEQRGTWLFWDAQQTKRKESYGGEPTQGKCVILL